MAKTTKLSDLTYESMQNQVEGIINLLGGDEIPLDELVNKVSVGQALLQEMRQRLAETKVKITELNTSLQESEKPPLPSS